MIIAVAKWEEGVSSTFDFASQFLIVAIENGRVVSSDAVEVGGASLTQRLRVIERVGAQVVICGALSRRAGRCLSGLGVQIYEGISGSIPSVLDGFTEGRLQEDCFCQPGAGRRRNGRHRRGAGRCARGMQANEPTRPRNTEIQQKS